MGAGKNAGFLLPFQNSTQQISTGRWSLSSRSNVPYVQLLGKGVNKTFTWGEVVEVPPGEICTLRNASYHAGDVWLNNGWDFDNRPASITVPVQINQTRMVGATGLVGPEYPGDVRLARRAYLHMEAQTLAAPADVYTIGLKLDGSHNTENEATIGAFAGQGSGYQRVDIIPAGTYIGLWPIGLGHLLGDDSRPMALLTTAIAWFEDSISKIFALPEFTAYYVMEY